MTIRGTVDNGRRIDFDVFGIIGKAGFVEYADHAELAYMVDRTVEPPAIGSEVLADGRRWRVERVERMKRPIMHSLRLAEIKPDA